MLLASVKPVDVTKDVGHKELSVAVPATGLPEQGVGLITVKL